MGLGLGLGWIGGDGHRVRPAHGPGIEKPVRRKGEAPSGKGFGRGF